MTSTRTDVHAPSSAAFDPELYDCVDVIDFCTDPMQGGSTPQERQAHLATIRDLQAQGYSFAEHVGRSNACGHCGAHLRYAALLVREDVKEMIYVGETCLDGRFELTKGEFDALRKSAQLDREAQRLLTGFREVAARSQGFTYATYMGNIDVALEAQAKNELGLDGFDAVCWAGLNWGINTAQDVVAKTRRYGSASDKQVALVERIVAEQDAKWSAFVEREQAKQAAKSTVTALTSGRQVIEGVVLTIKQETAVFGYQEQTVTKVLVLLDGGQRVWGTLPAAIWDAAKSDRIRFTATVTPKQGDETFGYYGRPTKAEIVATALVAA